MSVTRLFIAARPLARFLLAMLALPLALLLGACSSPGAGLPKLTETGRTEYRLGSGDTLRLLVFNDQRLSGEFRVNDNGTLAVPLVGSIPAAGKTVRELEASISSELQRQGLVRNAAASVEIIFQPGMTVLTAVAIGGGFTYRAERDYASITRVDGTEAREARAERQSFVQPGDVITVFERRF